MTYTRYVYDRINWLNKSESLATPLGKTNLNRMDSAIYNIAENLDVVYNEMSTGKLEKSDADKLIVGMPTWNPETGVLAFRFYDGTTFQVDFNIEKIPVSFSMDSAGVITMTTADGTEWTADIGDVIPTYTYIDSDTIAFSDTRDGDYGHIISAEVKKNSITGDHLQPDYLSDVTAQASNAKASAKSASDYADNAALDAKLSQSYAIGSSGIRDGEETDNAKYHKEQAEKAAEKAGEYLADLQSVQVTGVKGNNETAYRTGDVNITPANIGLENVGNFKAVSTIESQGLSDSEKANARANIEAGTSSFSGSYTDLVNKPTALPANGGTANYLNPILITTNANLNAAAYQTSGFYYCPANATVATFTNCPTKNAFFMIVGKHAGYYQEIIEYVTSNPKRWMRNCYNNTWGSWYRVYTEANKPTASEVGALATTGGILTGNVSFNMNGTTNIPFKIYGGDAYGQGISIGAGAATIVGGGESAKACESLLDATQEQLWLTSDGAIHFYTNCNAIGNKVGVILNSSRGFYPDVPNTGSLGAHAYRWDEMYVNRFNGSAITSDGQASTSGKGVVQLTNSSTSTSSTLASTPAGVNNIYNYRATWKRLQVSGTGNLSVSSIFSSASVHEVLIELWVDTTKDGVKTRNMYTWNVNPDEVSSDVDCHLVSGYKSGSFEGVGEILISKRTTARIINAIWGGTQYSGSATLIINYR